MAHVNTIFSQILKLVPRHVFNELEKKHHTGRALRANSRWDQMAALVLTKLSDDLSLRDIENTMKAHHSSLYHLGCSPVARSTLARMNEKQSYVLFEELFYTLLNRCQNAKPGHAFRFKNPLYSMDATQITLYQELFSTMPVDRNKNPSLKVHVALNHSGNIPKFVNITSMKTPDIKGAQAWAFEKSSIVVFDRGYFGQKYFRDLNSSGTLFVTRIKKGVNYRKVEHYSVPESACVTSDCMIEFVSQAAKRKYHPPNVRMIDYTDPETGKHFQFITNIFHLSARTVCQIYKDRWRIEIFFKYLKQSLKIKKFVGKSFNAVMSQIWITMIVHVILSYIKWSSRTGHSIQKMIKLVKTSLFSRKRLAELLGVGPPSEDPDLQMEMVF